MAEAIRVNFSKPIPLFPLPDTVLLPHAVLPLHVFERRYRQLVDDCIDGAKQIAMATLVSRRRKSSAPVATRMRPAVCVGQIIQHEAYPDGRHNILLHGVCRARITHVDEPNEHRAYCTADLVPLEVYDDQPPALKQVRASLRTLLTRPRLRRMRSVETVIEWFDRSEIPTHALLELISFTLIKDTELKYRLLEEPDPKKRAAIIRRELVGIDHLVGRAERQGHADWPKGMSWN
jgi:uncharacterized protein